MTTSTRDRIHAIEFGARIRAVRIQQGLSLGRVEEKSAGQFKAVVLGSYERGDRAMTMARLGELAEFYGVPVTVLLPDPPVPVAVERPRIRFDLPALKNAPAAAAPLRRWTFLIRQLRDDWGGQVLTVRTADLVHIAALLGLSPGGALGQMAGWEVLLQPVDLDAVELELANTTGARR